MSAATNSPTKTDETINASVRTIAVTQPHDPTEVQTTAQSYGFQFPRRRAVG